MIENDLGKVLNYMKQYVENKYEHDSEPMLNWKDLKLVLEEIERLKQELQDTKEHLGEYLYEQEEENKRLNNIINELEKWLEEDLKEVYRDAGYRHKLILEVQDKLQELKGSDK